MFDPQPPHRLPRPLVTRDPYRFLVFLATKRTPSDPGPCRVLPEACVTEVRRPTHHPRE